MTNPSAVTLINLFSVPEALGKTFAQSWHKTAEQMRQQPGFIDTTLHRSLKDDGEYRFVNVAHWESAEAFRQAQQTVEIFEKALDIEAHPALYGIEAEY